jgi:hypothetical protein
VSARCSGRRWLPTIAAPQYEDAATMLPFIDLEPVPCYETKVESAIDSGAVPDAIRADLLERAATSVGATIGPAIPDRVIVATVDVTLSIRFGALREAIETVLPIAIRFDAHDDHGAGTADWTPDRLLGAVVRNELDRVWLLRDAERFLVRAMRGDCRERSFVVGVGCDVVLRSTPKWAAPPHHAELPVSIERSSVRTSSECR